MTQVQTDAIGILKDKKQREGAKSPYAKAVYNAVRDAMIGFCEQQSELADAVMHWASDKDKTLGDCCEAIMKGCGRSISDLEVYAKAVEFYFPGAKVEMKMTVYMSEHEKEEKLRESKTKTMTKSRTSAKILDLRFEDLFQMGGDGK